MNNAITSTICLGVIAMGGLTGLINDHARPPERSLEGTRVAIRSSQTSSQNPIGTQPAETVETFEELDQTTDQQDTKSGFEGRLNVTTNIEQSLKSLSEEVSATRKETTRDVRELRNQLDKLSGNSYDEQIKDLTDRVLQLESRSLSHTPMAETITNGVIVTEYLPQAMPQVYFHDPVVSTIQTADRIIAIDGLPVSQTHQPQHRTSILKNRLKRFREPANSSCVDGKCRLAR